MYYEEYIEYWAQDTENIRDSYIRDWEIFQDQRLKHEQEEYDSSELSFEEESRSDEGK